jgi:D-3-phosphoglycerate dehydrogenase
MFRIQTLNNISRNGLDRLPANLYRVANDVADADAVLVRSADMHETPIAPSV